MIELFEQEGRVVVRPEGECVISCLEEDLARVRENQELLHNGFVLDVQEVSELDTAYFQFLLSLIKGAGEIEGDFVLQSGKEFQRVARLYGLEQELGLE